jgi:hypothetical protein
VAKKARGRQHVDAPGNRLAHTPVCTLGCADICMEADPPEGTPPAREDMQVAVIYENQRKNRMGATVPPFLPQNLMPMERTAWSDDAGDPMRRDDPSLLPPRRRWAGDWAVVVGENTDAEGWQYNSNWPPPEGASGFMSMIAGKIPPALLT